MLASHWRKSSGLGLSIVKETVELNGATIDINNVADSGVRINIRFIM
jgi:signal transduction histidine kinase